MLNEQTIETLVSYLNNLIELYNGLKAENEELRNGLMELLKEIKN